MSQNINLNFDLSEVQGLALTSNATEVLYGGAAGGGKALALDTTIPTPHGWKLMAELEVGNQVFGADGKPTTIVAVSNVMHERPCYRVTFDDGASVIADEFHLWVTQTDAERQAAHKATPDYRAKRKQKRQSRGTGKKEWLAVLNSQRSYSYKCAEGYKQRTTKEIYETLITKRGRKNHSIPLAKPLDYETNNKLPIDPYVLGCWLGDGNADGAGFTTNDDQIVTEIQNAGYETTKRRAIYAYGILGLHKPLRELGLLKNKHIPQIYLTASINDRIDLLQGLMDTDGYCALDGSCEFDNTNKDLALQVFALIKSIGIKANFLNKKAKLRGRIIGDQYRIVFQPNIEVFRLKRKLARQKPSNIRSLRRIIVDVQPVESVPVKCIQVSNDDGCYLATRDLIVTHNSHVARVLSILWALEIPGLQIYFFRRLYDDLLKNHVHGPTGFVSMLHPWINNRHPRSPLIGQRLCEVVEGEIRFWNGSRIFLCHLQHQKDLTKYYGPEFHVLFIEEATQFTEFMIRFLRSRMRIPKSVKIPDKYLKPKQLWASPNEPSYLFPRAFYTSNPGGVGHGYLKRIFLDGFQPLEYHFAPAEDGSHLRQFIPAKVDDNPHVNREEYKKTLAGLPPVLVDAMLNGNWNAVIGAYYPEIDPAKHVIRPFNIPAHWTRLMALDWGACGEGDPFAVVWAAVSDGCVPSIPRGALVFYRSWYGKGLPKMTATQVARGILQREQGDAAPTMRVAGGDLWDKRGTGPSLQEIFSQEGVQISRADQRRVFGWMQIRERLVGKNEIPAIYFFNTMQLEFDTLMQLQHDPNQPDDCSPGEDHFADAVRYLSMIRPYITEQPAAAKPLEQIYKPPTIGELWELRDIQNKRRR